MCILLTGSVLCRLIFTKEIAADYMNLNRKHYFRHPNFELNYFNSENKENTYPLHRKFLSKPNGRRFPQSVWLEYISQALARKVSGIPCIDKDFDLANHEIAYLINREMPEIPRRIIKPVLNFPSLILW